MSTTERDDLFSDAMIDANLNPRFCIENVAALQAFGHAVLARASLVGEPGTQHVDATEATANTAPQASDCVLKPCPFCGGEASADGVARFHDKHEAWYSDGKRVLVAFFCNCMRCGISNRGVVGGHQTREKAIAAWNRRASPPAATAQNTPGGNPAVRISEYLIADDARLGTGDISVRLARQLDGRELWAVRKAGSPMVLNKRGEWEYEPMPSSRDDEFLARCRFDSAQEAIDAALSKEK